MTDVTRHIREIFDQAAMSDAEKKQALRDLVRENWPGAEITEASTPRKGPTRAYLSKVKSLEDLTAQAEEWRAAGKTIGFTSGVYDILHPGHISFLEDANRGCDVLVVVIASDRTVKEQKGPEKPYITELKRAQTLAALDSADAVIISDEKFHETILKALKPDFMFKGDDYAGKQIIGAELAGKVVLVPCAEKEFYSSSAFVKKIKAGEPDKPPKW
ncbi:MAG: pantoate--beta-alanine ligase [Alphaproteobacteria bacterium]